MTLDSKCVLFSYHQNQQELILKISSYLKNGKLPAWINIEDGIDQNLSQKYFISRKNDSLKIRLKLFSSMNGINVVVCFLTPMYQSSKSCQQQIRMAKKLKIPIIAACLLPNWKPSGWLSKFYSFD